jgi:hypothetical protein
MWATFCDDVRQEAGNKLSYMGIYGANLVVPSIPTTLVKVCCVFSIRMPTTSPPKQVIFRLLKNDEVIFEAEMPAIDLNDSLQIHQPNDSDARALTIGSIAQLIPFHIDQPCTLRARAIIDGKELRGGGLEVLAAEVAH